VGDSTTFGAEVEDHQTLPSRVALELGDLPGVRVYNAGVRGYSALQARGMLELRLRENLKVDLVVYSFTSNDLVENFFPLLPVQVSAPRLRPLRAGGFRVQAASLAPTQVGKSFGSSSFWLRKMTRRLRRTFALADLAADLVHLGTLAPRLFAMAPLSMEMPGSASRSVLSDQDTGCPEELSNPADRGRALQVAWTCGAEEAFKRLLSEMQELAHRAGASFVVTAFPGECFGDLAALFPFHGSLEGLCRVIGVKFLPVRLGTREVPGSYRAHRPWLGLDPHFSARGNQVWASVLAPQLREFLGQEALPVKIHAGNSGSSPSWSG
jgi:lysophospholipase L1-like esterase